MSDNSSLELTSEIEMLTDEPDHNHITYHLYNTLREPLFSFSSKDKTELKKGINKLNVYFKKTFFNLEIIHYHFL